MGIKARSNAHGLAGLTGLAISLLAIPAFAHHSFAMFDHDETVVMTGTVTDFEWINPHAWVHLDVMGDDGKTASWSFEGGSTGQLAQSGWSKDSLHVGVQVDLEFHPLKDGSHGGQLLGVTFTDGRSLCQGPECRAAAAAAAAAQ